MTDTACVESSLEEHGSDYTDIDGEYPKLRIPFAPPARRGEKYSKRTRMQRQQDAAQKQPGPRRELGSPVNMTKGKNAKKGSIGGRDWSDKGGFLHLRSVEGRVGMR